MSTDYGKVISINNKKYKEKVCDEQRYKFRIVPVIEKEQNSKDKSIVRKNKKVLIELMDLKFNLVKVYHLSEFILLWRNRSYNTQKNKANTTIRFFNYLLNNNDKFQLSSFADLEVYHGEEYLSSLTLNGCNENYFLAERKTLDKLYLFMAKKELLNNVNVKIFDDMKVDDSKYNYNYKYRNGILPIKGTIFHDCAYPSNKKKPKRLHYLKEEFVIPLIETALEVEPRIALGIFFQCFGGLRMSEVVNIKKSSISTFDWGTVKLSININEEIISETYKDYNQACNKTKRKQIVYNVGDYLPNLLKMHLIDRKYYALDGSDALFSNKKGNLLTSKMYNYYFNKVKKAFINKLLRSNHKEIRLYGMYVNMEEWSTHIGRGIASNYIADSTNNAHQVSTFRGDRSLDSSLAYTEDTSKFKEMIYESGSKMYSKGIEMHNKLK